MVNKKKLGLRLHGLTRFAAAIWALSVWIAITPYVAFANVVDPATWFAAMGFWFAGASFIYDSLTVWPERGKFIGLTPAIMFAIFGIINIVFGLLTFTGSLNPYLGGDLVTYASIFLGLGVVSLFIVSAYEIYAARRLMKYIKNVVR